MRTREVGFGSNENQTKTQIILGQIFQKFDSLLLECIWIHISFCFHCKWIPFILIDRKSEETFIHSFMNWDCFGGYPNWGTLEIKQAC